MPAFADKGDDEDADVDFQNDDDINVDEEPEPDPNRDDEADEDDEPPTQAIPKKQKFSSFEKVCDSNNFDRLPDQTEETFEWRNKAGDRYEWCTLLNNTETSNLPHRGQGRRAASNIVRPGGPTNKAKTKSKSTSDTWGLMITDDNEMMVIVYAHKDHTAARNPGQPIDRNRQENPVQAYNTGRNESLVQSVVSSKCLETKYNGC